MLGSIGPTELILILLIVIIIFGARKLPDLGKSIGDGIKNFKKS
ncbi:MAG TPA: twin-arginine translocase TatA/TatE family subunit, partial [Candidatus Latescibacteria bacterium]|nr:twin-arginine translocase TatA/TatE family subunit [Candidatus Latescibacterota bacterium]